MATQRNVFEFPESLIARIEKRSGQSISEMRQEPLDEKRVRFEKKSGKEIRFTRNFPLLGRGNVMGDRTLSGKQVNDLLDQAL